MHYRNDRYGNPLSLIGYGCMRFTQRAGRIDIDKAEKEIMTAFKNGVNYYDTAYTYAGSEAALGEIVSRNGIRDKINIATKFPHYLIKKEEQIEKTFQEELKRLRTDHIDYYLMHMLTDINTWERLKLLGIEQFIAAKKESGEIRQIGFSYHGNTDMFKQLLDAYDWDFCQIQYNYMDEHSQAGREGLQYAASKGLPVIIMEPLRGGRLVSHIPKTAEKLFQDYPVQHTPADWAFRWLFDQPEVTVVLSGMNSVEMVEENVRTASETEAGSLTEADHELLTKVAAAINAGMKVGCTGCRYCMPCPNGVDIPGTFAAYNRKYSEGTFAAWKDYAMTTVLRKNQTMARNCIGCGKCERHCPQHIAIREELQNARKVLEKLPVKVFAAVAPKFMKY